MKKYKLIAIIAIFICLPLITSCSDSVEVYEIRDQFFARQVENIFMHLDSYVGRTIQIEGLFLSWHDVEDTGEMHHFVVRFLSDCCGGGGSIGFEINLGNIAPPPNEAWVQLTGVLELHDTFATNNPVLMVTTIQELEEQGELIIFS